MNPSENDLPVSPRYSVNGYILMITISATGGFLISAIVLKLVGMPTQGILVVLLGFFPIAIYSVLKGFQKGLGRYYKFKEPPK